MAMNLSKFEHNYEFAEDQHVCSYVVYGDSETNKLYVEASKKTEVTVKELDELFITGRLLISVGTALLVPVSRPSSGSVATIGEESSALAFVTWTAASE